MLQQFFLPYTYIYKSCEFTSCTSNSIILKKPFQNSPRPTNETIWMKCFILYKWLMPRTSLPFSCLSSKGINKWTEFNGSSKRTAQLVLTLLNVKYVQQYSGSKLFFRSYIAERQISASDMTDLRTQLSDVNPAHHCSVSTVP